MTTTQSKHVPLQVVAGVCPPTDASPAQTEHYTAADKIRFINGMPQKLGGWKKIIMNGYPIRGKVRSIFSALLNSKVTTILGSSGGLYALLGSRLTNITPLEVTTTAVPNSLATHYNTLANNPITTTNGSNMVNVADANADDYLPGDLYTLSGATAVGGIGTLLLNKDHIVREVAAGVIRIKVSANATSTATGGGAAVVRKTGLITLTDAAHGLPTGRRVKIAGATDTGGILAAAINKEWEIRNAKPNTFDVMTDGTATSSVSAAGGAATEYYQQIQDGLVDAMSGQGYGMGLYGDGLYGTALVSENAIRYPQIWFSDQFGEIIVTTPGNGNGVYRWDGQLAEAPELVPNAPANCNYLFVSNNILVMFGEDEVPNRITGSDQNDIEQYVSSSTNQVFRDDIEGSGRLTSHVSLNGTNLIFSNNKCYTFRYIGLPFVWEIKFKDQIGIIAPMARVVVKGVAYFMGNDNFYMWKGGNIEIVPSNSGRQTTLLKYVFQNINRAQVSKSFAWYNKLFDEIWFHYPSAGSMEVDRVARYHVSEQHWTPDTFDRLAAEYPALNLQYPRLIDSNNNFFRHEVGRDDDIDPLAFSLTTNRQNSGTSNSNSVEIIPDSVQSGNIDFTIEARSYPQSDAIKNQKDLVITPTTEFHATDIDGRFIQYTFEGAELGQEWIMGQWLFGMQPSSRSQ